MTTIRPWSLVLISTAAALPRCFAGEPVYATECNPNDPRDRPCPSGWLCALAVSGSFSLTVDFGGVIETSRGETDVFVALLPLE